jgi:hypothetical protein
MSKKKQDIVPNFHLSFMEQTGCGMNIPDGFVPVKEYHFQILLESIIDTERQLIAVVNRIDIKINDIDRILGSIVAKYWFEVEDFDQNIKKNKAGAFEIPQLLQLSFNAVALSTTRGLLFSSFRGTALHNAILPLIDPSQFEVNEVKL